MGNIGSSSIKVRAQDGTVTDHVTGMAAAPYGLELLGDVLYACTGGGVRGYDRSTGAQVFQIALGATFANGITTDGTHLYVTDFSGGRIFKVDPVGNSFTTLVQGLAGQPNGIAFRPESNELLVGFWGGSAFVRGYDAITGANTANVASGMGNIDGVVFDCHGRVLISTWSPARISRFEWGVPSPVFENLNVAGLNNPADIDYDPVNDRVCIPNTGNHTVTLFDLNCAPTHVPSVTADTALRVRPNPAQDRITVEPRSPQAEPYLLLNTRGSVIGGGTLSSGAQLDITPLAPGVYTLQFTRTAHKVRFVKE